MILSERARNWGAKIALLASGAAIGTVGREIVRGTDEQKPASHAGEKPGTINEVTTTEQPHNNIVPETPRPFVPTSDDELRRLQEARIMDAIKALEIADKPYKTALELFRKPQKRGDQDSDIKKFKEKSEKLFEVRAREHLEIFKNYRFWLEADVRSLEVLNKIFFPDGMGGDVDNKFLNVLSLEVREGNINISDFIGYLKTVLIEMQKEEANLRAKISAEENNVLREIYTKDLDSITSSLYLFIKVLNCASGIELKNSK